MHALYHQAQSVLADRTPRGARRRDLFALVLEQHRHVGTGSARGTLDQQPRSARCRIERLARPRGNQRARHHCHRPAAGNRLRAAIPAGRDRAGYLLLRILGLRSPPQYSVGLDEARRIRIHGLLRPGPERYCALDMVGQNAARP